MNKYDFSTLSIVLIGINFFMVGLNVYWGLHIGLPFGFLNFVAAGFSLFAAHYCMRK